MLKERQSILCGLCEIFAYLALKVFEFGTGIY